MMIYATYLEDLNLFREGRKEARKERSKEGRKEGRKEGGREGGKVTVIGIRMYLRYTEVFRLP